MMSSPSENVALRLATLEDKNFIMATWLKGLRHGNDWYSLIDQKAYFEVYPKVIESILASSYTEVRIACLRSDPEVILGYIVVDGKDPAQPTRAHWIFVKKAWRGIGIARLLTPTTITTVTHLTKTGLGLMKKHQHLIFNPFN